MGKSLVMRQARVADWAEIGRVAAANGQPREDSGRDRRYLAHLAEHGRLLVAEASETTEADAAGAGGVTGAARAAGAADVTGAPGVAGVADAPGAGGVTGAARAAGGADVADGPGVVGVAGGAGGAGVRLAGFAAARRVDGVTLLCDLFVDPARHGRGIGRRLLDEIFDGSADRVTFSSQDPSALPLYARYGLAPRWPLLYLTGDPAAVAPAATAGIAWRARRVPASDAAAAEHALTGVDRAPDYTYWGGADGSGGVLVERGPDVIAAGAAGPAHLRHLAVARGADPADTATAALPALAALPAAGSRGVTLCLPGPHPALGPLLRCGFRVEDFDHSMSTAAGLVRSGDVLSPALA